MGGAYIYKYVYVYIHVEGPSGHSTCVYIRAGGGYHLYYSLKIKDKTTRGVSDTPYPPTYGGKEVHNNILTVHREIRQDLSMYDTFRLYI